MESERDIEKRLVTGVRRCGGVAFKFVSPGHVGVPDRLVALPGGRVVFVELKTEKGRLVRRQVAQIRRLTALGFDVRVLFGKDDVDAFLEEVMQSEVHTT